jgi:hypothetical protein
MIEIFFVPLHRIQGLSDSFGFSTNQSFHS